MQILANHIETEVEMRGLSAVYEPELSRVWPKNWVECRRILRPRGVWNDDESKFPRDRGPVCGSDLHSVSNRA